jgi:hypothetical protein
LLINLAPPGSILRGVRARIGKAQLASRPSHALKIATYIGSSTRKVLLAAHHLRSFREGFARLPLTASSEAGPEDLFIPLDAHADGCVLQLFAAMDAFACAAAWHFGLRVDDTRPDHYSFGLLAKSPPISIAEIVERIATSRRYGELRRQRHRAGHRGLVFPIRSFAMHAGRRLETIDREEAEEVLSCLFVWTQHAVRLLQARACFQGWPGTGDHETNLLNRWSPLDSGGAPRASTS